VAKSEEPGHKLAGIITGHGSADDKVKTIILDNIGIGNIAILQNREPPNREPTTVAPFRIYK
jgi:hypothetical protein